MNELNNKRSLGKSVDILREDIKELYELDQDNYARINELRTAINNFSNNAKQAYIGARAQRRKTTFGFMLLGTGIYYVGKALMHRIELLTERVDALEKKNVEG